MERLLKRGQAIAQERVEVAVNARLERPLPPGITAERIATGITLSGRGLRRRYVTDAAMRTLTLREFSLSQPFSREGGSPEPKQKASLLRAGLPPSRENGLRVTRIERVQ